MPTSLPPASHTGTPLIACSASVLAISVIVALGATVMTKRVMISAASMAISSSTSVRTLTHESACAALTRINPRWDQSRPGSGSDQGISTVLPVVFRDSSAMWALAASCSGKVWLIWIFTAPELTTLNRSAATASRSERFAV